MDSPQKIRLFIAVPVPSEVRRRIEKAQLDFTKVLPSKLARWTRPEQFHLTLRFLGNVPSSRVESLVSALAQSCASFSALHLDATGVGFFPNHRNPRVLWAGVRDADNVLNKLWESLCSATQPFTVEPAEKHFSGHITLARLDRLRAVERESLAKLAAQLQNEPFGTWTASGVQLVRSDLSPQGARHTVLGEFPLPDRKANS